MTPDARLHLPREPYPGLRPYLDFEAALLFGRERQVDEVMERLAATQFVAVLGGSGSGKSSLVIAGLTPRLRSYGIPGAGDLWLAMSCTPGTNATASDAASRRSSPVTRLAHRFAALLESRGSAEADALRETEIAEIFRQEAGLARLVDAYSQELALPPGPDPAEARLLIVLDQFEEVFHPTNRGVADADLLVERVLDHFFNPHPRCFVVLTMRSEYLNHCAAYLELPDAINKSSYLVRRLDESELREVITGPAQRFLRLATRSDPNRALPREVQFEAAVVERVLRDASTIAHDPDHLPLLQHLLARLWQVALEREDIDAPVPSRVTEMDLMRAVSVDGTGEAQPLGESINTLRACVDHWPERLYQWHDAPQRAALDALLRRLALRDPNTGQYSQQRLGVDEATRLLGAGKTRADLRALLAEGSLGGVDYLFWDDEDPARVSLKVSHESFIRGWTRFRALVDDEARRFEEFSELARRGAEWVGNARQEAWLLEANEARRLLTAELRARLADPAQRAASERLLALGRDGARIARGLPALDDFVAQSLRRQRLRARGQSAATLAAVAMFLFALVPVALFAVFVQTPTLTRVAMFFDAGNLAAVPSVGTSSAEGADASALEALLRAADGVSEADTGKGVRFAGLSQRLFVWLGGITPVRRQAELLAAVGGQTEGIVNGRLRSLMTGAVWFADAALAGSDIQRPRRRQFQGCSVNFAAPGAARARSLGEPQGTLWVAAAARPSDPAGLLPAVFVPDASPRGRGLEVYGASFDSRSGACWVSANLMSLPETVEASVVFDAGLRYFITSTGEGASASTVVQEIDWQRRGDRDLGALHRRTVMVLTDPGVAARVRAAAGPGRVEAVPTRSVAGGRALTVNGAEWRVVSAMAEELVPDRVSAGARPAVPVPPESTCGAVGAAISPLPGTSYKTYDLVEYCLVVSESRPGGSLDHGAASSSASGASGVVEFGVALYPRVDRAAGERLVQSATAPIAVARPYARIPLAPEEQLSWALGTEGSEAGWLLLRVSRPSAAEWLIGLPMTTCALRRLGSHLAASRPESTGTGCASL